MNENIQWSKEKESGSASAKETARVVQNVQDNALFQGLFATSKPTSPDVDPFDADFLDTFEKNIDGYLERFPK